MGWYLKDQNHDYLMLEWSLIFLLNLALKSVVSSADEVVIAVLTQRRVIFSNDPKLCRFESRYGSEAFQFQQDKNTYALSKGTMTLT